MTDHVWSTIETRTVYEWLTSDRATYHHCRDLTRRCRRAARLSGGRDNSLLSDAVTRIALLADQLRALVLDRNPLAGQAGVFADLLEDAICRVQWREIARRFLQTK